ncbi:MAG TPA: hypothetical protein VMQ76_05670 [Terracidiphilus sp.]|nr:hypothetical protein [Terracidiphilus sp.]
MNSYRDKSVLCVDHGLYISTALRLARDFGKVGYHCAWKRGFPSFNEIDIGHNLDGITPEPNLFKVVDNYDLIVFPDILDGDLQVYLRKQGHRVYGSGMGEELELFRVYQKRMFKAVGLPVGPYRVVKGITALREYLKAHDDKVIKLSLLRGITETFKHRTYWESEARIDRLQHELGMRKERTEFVVEDEIKSKIEMGYDGPCVHGKFPAIAANGVEAKDAAYACIVQNYEDLPEEMREVNAALAHPLNLYGYSNFFSTEIRVAEDGTPYCIDITARKPSPAGETQEELWSNLAEMMWAGAAGDMVDPIPTAKYAVQSIIYSDWADENWQGVGFPEKFRNNVKLYYHTRENGHDYVIPQQTKMNEIGSIVTIGDDLKATIKENKAIAEQVTGDKIRVCTDRIGEVVKEFDEMEKQGMDLTPATV